MSHTGHTPKTKVRTERSVLQSGQGALQPREETVRFLQGLDNNLDLDSDAPLHFASDQGDSAEGATGGQGEAIMFFETEGKTKHEEEEQKQKDHRLSKRFNEFVGKRDGGSRPQAWTQGTNGGRSFLSMRGDELTSREAAGQEAGEGKRVMARSQLARVMLGDAWRNLGAFIKSATPQVSDKSLGKNLDHRRKEMLKGRTKWNGNDDEASGTSNELNAFFPLPVDLAQTTARGDAEFAGQRSVDLPLQKTKKWAEFPGKRSMPPAWRTYAGFSGQRSVDLPLQKMKKWAEFPGKRSITPSMKRYAEFLGKRSLAIASGALVADLERDFLRRHQPLQLSTQAA
ncbi:hypothetical protein ElyMa_005335600 [Elysia marginata]|uniref:Uncharacterized protein n=1 Tax=Elysia marginata TaxID=1093978 RepID=A0AAV4E7V9_9GAST|nr:hypothetical protein ElyMa_005335600 [Elysia marginata]